MVSPTEAGLHIPEYGGDPLERRQILLLAAADDCRLMGTPSGRRRSEAGKAVGAHGATWRQVLARPVLQGPEGRARNRGELHPQREVVLGQRNRSRDWEIVLLPLFCRLVSLARLCNRPVQALGHPPQRPTAAIAFIGSAANNRGVWSALTRFSDTDQAVGEAGRALERTA